MKGYAASGASRFHMPGHKGEALLGCEALDITEIPGADSLYEAAGILKESEENATRLFDSGATFYSAEGSSLAIRAMLYLACLAYRAKRGQAAGQPIDRSVGETGEQSVDQTQIRSAARVNDRPVGRTQVRLAGRPAGRPAVAAGRNAHRAFLTAAALLDFDILWLWPKGEGEASLCSSAGEAEALAELLADRKKCRNLAAVYVTSPDYLGHVADVEALASLAHAAGLPLLVDNAHGAYLRFLPEEVGKAARHPLTLGADLCCDSAHKTLPVLTGGAYLHVAKGAEPLFASSAKEALALFGSTSPSYLILQSLDRVNRLLAEGYRERLSDTVRRLSAIKEDLREKGWFFVGEEPLKLTFDAKKAGYTGKELAERLAADGIIAEYADPDYAVLMAAPGNREEDFARLAVFFEKTFPRPALPRPYPALTPPAVKLSVREAMLSPWERLPLRDAVGKIAAQPEASCPPAISPLVPGELVEEGALALYRYYGIEELTVLCRDTVQESGWKG